MIFFSTSQVNGIGVVSLPAFRLGGDFGYCRRPVDRIFALSLLILIVFEQAYGIFAEHDDGREVTESHERHSDIGETPDEVK